jgi:hypothetical protein
VYDVLSNPWLVESNGLFYFFIGWYSRVGFSLIDIDRREIHVNEHHCYYKTEVEGIDRWMDGCI